MVADPIYDPFIRGEVLALGKASIKAMGDFEQRRFEATYRIATDPAYQIDLNDILPPQSTELIQALIRIAQSNNIPDKEIAPAIGRYFNDYKALLKVPTIKISSIMYAGLARSAGLGKKTPPKSTADVQFISSYLPYCDAMFVDVESRKLLQELPQGLPKHLKLSEFQTKVFSLKQKDEFLKYLDAIVDVIPDDQKKAILDVSGEDYDEPYWSIIQNEKSEMRASS